LKLNRPVVSFEINLAEIIGRKTMSTYRAYSVFPAIQRDISLIVTEDLLFSGLAEEIDQINQLTITTNEPKGLIKSIIQSSDVYRHERIGPGKKNLTIRCVFQSHHRTLTNTEVDKLIHKIIERLTSALGVSLRGDSNPK
jgi:phenylalanyl-tRNA synthetase beta chain